MKSPEKLSRATCRLLSHSFTVKAVGALQQQAVKSLENLKATATAGQMGGKALFFGHGEACARSALPICIYFQINRYRSIY
jgi:hypothetical protein